MTALNQKCAELQLKWQPDFWRILQNWQDDRKITLIINRAERKEQKYLCELNVKQNMWKRHEIIKYSKEYWEGWKKELKCLDELIDQQNMRNKTWNYEIF